LTANVGSFARLGSDSLKPDLPELKDSPEDGCSAANEGLIRELSSRFSLPICYEPQLVLRKCTFGARKALIFLIYLVAREGLEPPTPGL